MQILNPEISDVFAHVKLQYEAFAGSSVAAALEIYARVTGRNPIELFNQFFDAYASMRYGYSGRGFLEDISRNKTLQLLEFERDMTRDNAYYSRSSKVDLTTVLKPRANEPMTIDQAEAIILGHTIENLVDKVALPKQARMIFLPRTGQEIFGSNISTLKDLTVAAHELGHHINRSLIKPFSNHLMLEEVLADYLAAAGLKNPSIGAFFAAVSEGKVQKILIDSRSGVPLEVLQKSAEEVLAKSMLRSLETLETMDTIPRVFSMQEDHDAANPVRRFLWQIRKRLPGREAEFDRIVLDSIRKMAERPVLMSVQTDALLSFRKWVMNLRRGLKIFHESMKLKIFFGRGLTISENMLVSRTVEENEKALEAKRASRRSLLRPFGLAFRSRVPADYVIPEFLRVVYRAASGSPDIQAIVRQEADFAMNAKSMEITLNDGSRDLLFARTRLGALNPAVRVQAKRLLERQHDLLGQFLSGDLENPSPKILSEYGETLQALQEYERTGRTYRLFWSYPTVKVALAIISSQVKKEVAEAKESMIPIDQRTPTGPLSCQKVFTGRPPP